MTDKIKPAQITLIHATGANDVGQGELNGVIAGTTAVVSSYEEANETLLKWLTTNLEGHFNSIDWTIRFEDGFEKSGVYELGKPRNDVLVAPNFVDAITNMSLRLLSDDPKDAKFLQFIDKDGSYRARAKVILDKYDHGLDEAPALKM